MNQCLFLFFSIVLTSIVNAQNQASMTINQEAPVVQTKDINIDASPERVWDVLTTIENWDDWNDRIKSPSLYKAIGVGESFTWKTNNTKIKSKIQLLTQNKIFGWTGKTFGASAIHIWYLKPIENGTNVRVEESMEGWLIKLMKKKMNKKLEDDMAYWLEQLKAESEK